MDKLIRLAHTRCIDRAIDGGVGSTFINGGAGNTFYLDVRGYCVSWPTIIDFVLGGHQTTNWYLVKVASSIDATINETNACGVCGV